MSDVRCHVCGKGMAHYVRDQEWVIAKRLYQIVECDACGTAFTDPLPDDDLLAELYAKNFDYGWYRDHLWAKKKDAELRYGEYRTLLGRRIMDFGGGLGYFSEVCRKRGHDSITYDPYSSKQDRPDGTFDTVVALHVLEHANDLGRIVSAVASFLRPDGNLIAAVPNYDGLGYRSIGFGWVWAQSPLIHTHHFTARGISTALARGGFTNCLVSYHERWDANIYCDVEHFPHYARCDAYWGRRPYSQWTAYRRTVAFINSARRLRGLEKSIRQPNAEREALSELQIVARFAGAASPAAKPYTKTH